MSKVAVTKCIYLENIKLIKEYFDIKIFGKEMLFHFYVNVFSKFELSFIIYIVKFISIMSKFDKAFLSLFVNCGNVC